MAPPTWVTFIVEEIIIEEIIVETEHIQHQKH